MRIAPRAVNHRSVAASSNEIRSLQKHLEHINRSTTYGIPVFVQRMPYSMHDRSIWRGAYLPFPRPLSPLGT